MSDAERHEHFTKEGQTLMRAYGDAGAKKIAELANRFEARLPEAV